MASGQWNDKQLSAGKLKLARFELWLVDNQSMYLYMEREALENASRGLPISGRALVEKARKKSFADSHGKDSRINNDYAPIIARRVAIEHPECRPYIERRSTVFDELMPYV